jgi:hypothetical protein
MLFNRYDFVVVGWCLSRFLFSFSCLFSPPLSPYCELSRKFATLTKTRIFWDLGFFTNESILQKKVTDAEFSLVVEERNAEIGSGGKARS